MQAVGWQVASPGETVYPPILAISREDAEMLCQPTVQKVRLEVVWLPEQDSNSESLG